MKTDEGRENLLRSLRKGNAQQITIERDGKDQKLYVTANPQFKTVDMYDAQMKKMKREELLSPGVKIEKTQHQGKQQNEALTEKPAKKIS